MNRMKKEKAVFCWFSFFFFLKLRLQLTVVKLPQSKQHCNVIVYNVKALTYSCCLTQYNITEMLIKKRTVCIYIVPRLLL